MQKIRILHVVQAAGGVDRYIRMLLKYLDKEEFENIMVCSQDFHKGDYKGLADCFEQIEMNRAIGMSDLKSIREVRKQIKKYNPDIIYAHSSKAGAIARMADIGLKNRCVYNPHGWAFNMRCSEKKKMMYAGIEKMTAPYRVKTVCTKDNCTGCMACVESCPQNAIKVVDELDSYNAIINEEQCVNCDLCRKVCQNNRIVKFTQPIMWKQGWARDTLVRSSSSSGGVAQAIERAFVRSGGVVCSCAFEKGLFGFVFAESEKEVEKFKGSKYVKSNPSGIYKKIKEYLIAGRKVLFVGLPCQVEAVKCYVGEKFDNGLYTVDLICHGSPSPKVLDMFLAQYDIDTKKLSDIQFRNKNNFSVREGTSYIVQKGVLDKYSISFLNSISYTENCYHCQYANIMRVSDITLGDSWGSNLDIQEQRKGVSLILNQTLKGKELLEQSELELMDVELNRAIEHNHQLKHPSIKPNTRKIFFDEIKNGKNFNAIVRKLYPKQSAKQIVKMLLIKAKIMGV